MKNTLLTISTLILVLALSACSVNSSATVSAVVDSGGSSSTTSNTTNIPSTASPSVPEALAENSSVHEDANDYSWESANVVSISLEGNTISTSGLGVVVDGSTATITAAGTYSLSGSLNDGQIIVNTESNAIVRLILNGVDIYSSTSAPIYIQKSEETMIVLAEGSQNTIVDSTDYILENSDSDEPNAAIFSTSDLTIYGGGSLSVEGNYNDGIASKDGLIIASGTITVEAVDDGIRGKDYLVVENGVITVNAGGDGLKADNAEDATKGFISIEAGVLNITSAGDAITAETDVMVSGGEFTITSGGGSNAWVDENTSAKGIKGLVSVNIDYGSFTFDCADDAIHSNGTITINNGTFDIATGDDGMHADASLTINGGTIQISESYEGLESAVISLNGGEIHIASSDDGINVASGNDGSGVNPGFGGGRPGGPGQDTFNYSGDTYLYINGGYIYVDANGDGLDINGAIVMTGGTVLVNGPTENMNGALDYDAGFTISGGFLVAVGSAGMAQAPGQASSQNSLLINFSSTIPAGTLIHIQNSAGEEILTFSPTKRYQSLAFSSAELVNGETYTISYGGSSSGSQADGLYQGGSYSSGSQYTSFTVSGTVTMIGATGGGMRMRP